MTVLEHCRRVGCSQAVGALKQRIAELEAKYESAYSAGMVEGERVCIGRIKELESALDVALEALENSSTVVFIDKDKADLRDKAIAKLKEVRRAE